MDKFDSIVSMQHFHIIAIKNLKLVSNLMQSPSFTKIFEFTVLLIHEFIFMDTNFQRLREKRNYTFGIELNFVSE